MPASFKTGPILSKFHVGQHMDLISLSVSGRLAVDLSVNISIIENNKNISVSRHAETTTNSREAYLYFGNIYILLLQ